MKINFQTLVIGLLFISFVSSCTIEKRKYMEGYNFEWKIKTKQENKENFDLFHKSVCKQDKENNRVFF